MMQAFVTVVIPFAAVREARVNSVLDRLGARTGRGKFADPPRPAGLDARARRLLRRFVHFMSIVVIPEDGGMSAHLVIEICADGAPDGVLARLVEAAGRPLYEILQETGAGVPAIGAGLLPYLESHRVKFGTTLFSRPGLAFTGTPGMTVSRIRGERLLALRLRRILESKDRPAGSALQTLRYARSRIFRNVNLKWAFVSEPAPLLDKEKAGLDLYKSLAVAALRDYLWVLVPPPVLAGLYSFYECDNDWDTALGHLAIALVAEIAAMLLAFAVGYLMLRRQEVDDVPFDVEPDSKRIEEVMERENLPGIAQNHLAGVSILKLGLIRRVSLRIALWVIAEFQRALSRPGFLNRIGTIHFARWLLLPKSDRLVFLSNYDGSWQSYLEDFIARLRAGLTSVWSNTRDFPKTANLFVGGASDGTRFKRWARRQQLPTRFWYSAYPQLTTARIRNNAAIRHGFAGAASENEAAEWLSRFGYAAPENVQKEEISTLAFGGLPDFKYSCCLIVQFGTEAAARDWLRSVQDDLSYGEHVQLKKRATVAAFTADGLGKLGLGDTALGTFPAAFQQGMSAPGRSRTLGDEDTKDWLWGGLKAKTTVDAALILYAKDAKDLETHADEQKRRLTKLGHQAFVQVLLKETDKAAAEPFGFRDGVSQPIMRGSKHWSDPEYAMHVVEPGELVLGYRDNLGNLSPSPCDKGTDLGRNGTFLVIRQLEQHKAAFDKYVTGEAARLKTDPCAPGYEGAELEHWVAARMIGRWRDGSSLVRYPHPPMAKDEKAPQTPEPAPEKPEPAPEEADSKKKRFADNEFRYGTEDPNGLRCPLGAHIRRANPRDSFEPGSEVQLAISNRHRILRVGRVYEPEQGKDPGLLFMCVNADIERQFEFLQQTWILGSNFHGLDDEIDPVVGYRGGNDSMTVPTPRGPVRMRGLSKFVTMLGGAYFFIPGRSAIRVLAT